MGYTRGACLPLSKILITKNATMVVATTMLIGVVTFLLATILRGFSSDFTLTFWVTSFLGCCRPITRCAARRPLSAPGLRHLPKPLGPGTEYLGPSQTNLHGYRVYRAALGYRGFRVHVPNSWVLGISGEADEYQVLEPSSRAHQSLQVPTRI